MTEIIPQAAGKRPAANIRVLHLIYTIEGGGAEQQLTYLTHHSDPSQIENAVCVFNDKGLSKIKSGIKTFVIDRKHRFDFSMKKIREVYKSWRPDVIHIWLPSELIYGLPAAILERRSQVIASFRGNYRLNSIKRLLLLPCFLLSDAIVSNIPQECLYPPYRQIYQLKKGHLIPNGFPVGELRAASASNYSDKNAQAPFRLLFVGRLNPVKNIPLLFDALHILLSQGISCELVLAGDGRQREELIRLCQKMDLDQSVRFLGYREDVTQLMGQSDLLVLSSFREGMSNSLFEALACGLPVAASDIPVHRYWLTHGQNAILFDPHDAQDLADRIKAMMDQPEAEIKKIIAGGQALVEDLTAAKMALKYQDFYRELVSDG